MADTGFKNPSATGEDYNNWANPTNAYASDNSNASEFTLADQQDYYNFAFGVPAGATIVGIEVSAEGKSATADVWVDLGVELSWNGGVSYTTSSKIARFDTNADEIEVLGGATDTWGRSWSQSEFSDANFRVKIKYEAQGDTTPIYLDHIKIKVYYTEGGGSGPANVKSINGIAEASIKSVNGQLIADIKSINGIN